MAFYRVRFESAAADPPTIGETVEVRSEGTLNCRRGVVTSVEPNGVINVRMRSAIRENGVTRTIDIERPVLPGEIVRDVRGVGRR